MSERSHASSRPYWLTWVALLALTLTSFGFSYVRLGSGEMPVALLIAVAKALLVASIFMHLRGSPFGYRFVGIIGVLFLVVMLTFTLLDLVARGSPGVAPPMSGSVPGSPP